MKSKRGKVLITDGVHPLLIEGLETDGFSVDYDTKIEMPEIRRRIHNYVGIVINSRILMDREMIDLNHDLCFIARLGSGKEIIDIPYAEERGIAVITSPEGNANSVAEHVLGMILNLLNKIQLGDQRVRKFHWNREANRGIELEGKTIGIIGFGHTGTKVAEKLSGFGVKILVYDKYRKHFGDEFRSVEESELGQVLEESDIITLHVPLTEETLGMVDAAFLKRCKSGMFLINTSRGMVVDTKALIDALDRQHLAGAGLDVFENEKPEMMNSGEKRMYERLFSFENTVFSPHVAGWTHESKRKLAQTVLDKIRGLKGKN